MNELVRIIEIIFKEYIQNEIFRIIFIVLIAFYYCHKIIKMFNHNLIKNKNIKSEYIRKMFCDLKNKNKQSFLFSMQEYMGVKLNKKEIVYIVNNNFYFFSKYLKDAYSKIIFKNGKYNLRFPILGYIWAIFFYIITCIPTLLYIFVYINTARIVLSHEQFIMFNIMTLPLFVWLSIIAIINLNNFGAAKCICNFEKKTNIA